MENLRKYFDYILNKNPYLNPAAVDLNHAMLLLGIAMSNKPKDILELGIGTAFISFTLLTAIKYNNNGGQLTCIDNFQDLGGNMPRNIPNELTKLGAKIIAPIDEYKFVSTCSSDSYDLIVSDADHTRAGKWVDEILRIARSDAFIFIHDADNKDYPGLRKYSQTVKDKNFPHFLFNKSTRQDERCHLNGWLMFQNKK